jgi:hypothetical protein
MSNPYRGTSIDASYQISVHLAKRFQRGRFKKIGQSETRIAYGTALPNEPKLGRKQLWQVLYKECSFISDLLTDMSTAGNSCF